LAPALPPSPRYGRVVVLRPGRLGAGLPARLDLRGHVRQLELDRLELRDRPSELPPLLRVRECEVIRALREPDAHRRDRDAAAVEDLEELLEAAPSLPDHVLLPAPAVLAAQLVPRPRDEVAGRAVRDADVGDLVVARAGGVRDAGAEAGAGVRDEDLRAVHDPVPVAKLGPRLRRPGVGACAGLGQAEGRQ